MPKWVKNRIARGRQAWQSGNYSVLSLQSQSAVALFSTQASVAVGSINARLQ